MGGELESYVFLKKTSLQSVRLMKALSLHVNHLYKE